MNFKIGDHVRCVDDTNASEDLIVGGIYTVRGLNGSDLRLTGVALSYMRSRFEPVPAQVTGTPAPDCNTCDADIRAGSRTRYVCTLGCRPPVAKPASKCNACSAKMVEGGEPEYFCVGACRPPQFVPVRGRRFDDNYRSAEDAFQAPAVDTLRATGRTTRTVLQAVASITNPETDHVVIVAHNRFLAKDMLVRAKAILDAAGIQLRDHESVRAVTGSEVEAHIRGLRRVAVFTDHYTGDRR